MSAKTSRRICGALLLVSMVGVATVPAYAQSATDAVSSPDAAVYPYRPDADLVSPALKRQVVSYAGNEAPGTIIVDPAHAFLYFTLGDGHAIRYGIGVGREGFEWSGIETITHKAEWPDWTPPAAMIARQPYLPRWIGGGPGNPLGARALYLGHTDYRIHGTNDPTSIGKHMSSGCIRLLNADIIDLYNRVNVGTKVIVLPDNDSRPIGAMQTDIDRPAQAQASGAHAAKAALARTASRNNDTLVGIY
jgi:lipoprotein-anchoring transpeptidase ErfK/SrfK